MLTYAEMHFLSKRTVALEKLLAFDNEHYHYESNVTVISGKEYGFIKGSLTLAPKKYRNRFYDAGVKQPALYLIREIDSGQVYVGSSGHFYKRLVVHKTALKTKSHANPKFEELTRKTPLENFELIVVFTDDRREAYRLEDFFIARFKTDGTLMNVATDVVAPMTGRKHTEETRRLMSVAHSGKALSEEHRRNLSIARKTNPNCIAQLESIRSKTKFPVLLNGVRYSSIPEASVSTGCPFVTLYRHISNRETAEKDGHYVVNYIGRKNPSRT